MTQFFDNLKMNFNFLFDCLGEMMIFLPFSHLNVQLDTLFFFLFFLLFFKFPFIFIQNYTTFLPFCLYFMNSRDILEPIIILFYSFFGFLFIFSFEKIFIDFFHNIRLYLGIIRFLRVIQMYSLF